MDKCLIVLDMDGTLLNKRKEISLLTKNYLLELLKHVDENISFAFCNPMMIDKNDHEIGRCRDNTSLYKNKKSLCARLAQECVIASTGLIINRSKFIAVGAYGKMGYSTDGETWEAVSQSFTTDNIYSVCYENNK